MGLFPEYDSEPEPVESTNDSSLTPLEEEQEYQSDSSLTPLEELENAIDKCNHVKPSGSSKTSKLKQSRWKKKRKNRLYQSMTSQLTDIPSNCGILVGKVKVKPLDLFPVISHEYQNQKKAREIAKKLFKDKQGPEPPKDKISRRDPTSSEITHVYSIVKNPKLFRLYDHGRVRILDEAVGEDKTNKIVADIAFTNLKTITQKMRADLDFFLSFLQTSKTFVNTVGSESRSCGGSMWAIGWRKSTTHLEVVGHYVNTQAIKDNRDEYIQHLQDSKRAGEILWDLFYPMGNVALENNRKFMLEHNLPAFHDPKIPDETSTSHKNSFSTNLTFTSQGFFNHPHKDTRDDDNLPFAFLLCLPTWKETGKLALESDGYDVKDGHFVFPDLGFGIDFKPDTMVQMIFAQRSYTHGTLQPFESEKFSKLGMSMQIAKRTTNILDRVLAQEFVDKKSAHYVGDVPYILKKTLKTGDKK